MRRLDGILRRIEAMSVSGTERYWRLIPPDMAKRVRPRVARVGDGILTLMATSDSLRINRVIGLGHLGRAQESMIDAIIGHYRAARLERFSLLMSPGPQARKITRWLLKRGFTRHPGYALLLRDCRKPVPGIPSNVRVSRVSRQGRAAVVQILSEAFAVPASRRSWSMAAVAAPEYEHYMAFVGSAPVAVGALRAEDGLAWLGGGATRTRWRRRGAHASLIAARLRRAVQIGCTWAWSETAEPKRGGPDGSRRNLIRLGFEPACIKPSFVWRANASRRR